MDDSAGRKWIRFVRKEAVEVEKAEKEGAGCPLCYTPLYGEGYLTTCCDKVTCETCYLKLRSVCPYCNLALDEVQEHHKQNTSSYDLHMRQEAEVFNEAAARAIDQAQNEGPPANDFMFQMMLQVLGFMDYPGADAPEDPGAPEDQVAPEDPIQAPAQAEGPVSKWCSTQERIWCGGCMDHKDGGFLSSCCQEINGYCGECFPNIPSDSSHCLTCFRPVTPHEIHAKCACYSCLCTTQIEMYTILQADPETPMVDRQFYRDRITEVVNSLDVYTSARIAHYAGI